LYPFTRSLDSFEVPKNNIMTGQVETINAFLRDDDPVTSRGTVTTVQTS